MLSTPWFQEENIFNLIYHWKTSYSITPDYVPFLFLRKVTHVIARPFTYLCNQSLMRSEIPGRWKHSFVTPLSKKEPASDPRNYRPVSITSFFCRVFENVIKKVITDHLERNSIIPMNQHGFVKGRSVETNLLKSLNEWTTLLDDKKCCGVIYFDFSKAFDVVSHQKLIHKMSKVGFHPLLEKWLAEYLTGRTFQVKINGVLSTVRSVRSGIPQGAVLSPLLFILYTADLPSMFKNSSIICKQFADDLKIYSEYKEDDQFCLQRGINLMH